METQILDEKKFTVINNEGKPIECDAIFQFESEETHKHYIVYTDNSTDEAGNTRVYASIYTPGSDLTKLEPIETQEEWDKIQQILDVIQEEVRKAFAEAEEEDEENGEE